MNERLARLFDEAIDTLKQYEPPEGYYLAFSGGKDSIVCYDLLKRSGCKFDAHMNLTSVDPPELLAYVKEHYPDVERHRPELTMFQLIEKKCFLPSSKARFCEGFRRIGCIGCPMISANLRHQQFQRWPKHKIAYRNTIAKALAIKPSIHFGNDADTYLEWWLSNMSVKAFLGMKEQTDLFEEME